VKRTELETALRRQIVGCSENAEEDCTACHCGDDQLQSIMELIDIYTDGILKDLRRPALDLWTAERVAKHVGLLDANGARSWLSRARIKALAHSEHPVTGRTMALYPADRVRDEHARRRQSI
jgi:hypothetical protein